MRQPNFFIIGAPKCGTTSLSEYLRFHPQIFMSDPKEPWYWSDEDVPVDPRRWTVYRTLPEYLALFSAATADQRMVGEASTHYLWSERAVERILQFAPHARLIAMVRNPIDLVQSLHQEEVYALDEPELSLERAWRLQERRAQGESLPPGCVAPIKLQYRHIASLGTHFERILQFVPREQLLVLLFDDFVRDSAGAYAETLEFLGIEHDGRTEFPRINARKSHRYARLSQMLLRPHAAIEPLMGSMRSLAWKLGVRGLRSRLITKLSHNEPAPRMNPRLRAEMVEAFRGEIGLLSNLLGRDLSGWLRVDGAKSPAAEGIRSV